MNRQARLSVEIERELGTEQYITWTYQDTGWSGGRAGSVVVLHVPYYTGTIDTVPHVPERCYTGAGQEATGRATVPLTLTMDGRIEESTGDLLVAAELEDVVRVPTTAFDATRFSFRRPGGDQQEHVFYVFAANGKFLATPDQVRLEGFDPTDRYSYYAKVEVRVPLVEDEDQARARVEAFLSAAMPELLACLPDWRDVQAGDWPPDVAERDADADPATDPVSAAFDSVSDPARALRPGEM